MKLRSLYEAYSCSERGVNRACDPASGGEALRHVLGLPPPMATVLPRRT